jgi:hypothetical protein
MGLHSGNVAGFSKQRMPETMAALAGRGRRYAFAAQPASEAASGGFTNEERAHMNRDKT